MNSSAGILATSKGRPATVSPGEFPYCFPASPRPIGGGFDIREGRRRLAGAYHGHLILMRALAGRIIEIPEFEVKVEIAHHVHAHAEAARLLRVRLLELGTSLAELDGTPEAFLEIAEELQHAHGSSEFLAGTHAALSRDLLNAEAKYLAETDKLLDLPSIRALRMIALDLVPATEWGEAALEAYLAGGDDRAVASQWKQHISALVDASGVLTSLPRRDQKPPLRQAVEPPFQRKVGCERDGRFTTFHHTRNYRESDDLGAGAGDGFTADRLELVRVQRDEIDAIETFANVLYGLPHAPFDLQMDLARFIWDEARHAEIGHRELERLGFDPFAVPCGIIGINVRSPLRPEVALAQISIFGELNIIGPMRQLSDAAPAHGDLQTHITFDFIHSDELLHLRRGRHWLKFLHPSGGIHAIGDEARVQAIRRLVEEGVVGEDYASNMTPADIAAVIGGE